MKKILTAALLTAVLLFIAAGSQNSEAATVYSAGSLLQTGDVKSVHILNGTIADADVSATANVSATKVAPRGTTGTVLLTDGTKIATTTGLRYATSTGDLYINSGRVHASSTNFGGVNYSWPSADGTSAQVLSTDGAGTLSWASTQSQTITGTFTAGESVNTGDAVAIAKATATTRAASGSATYNPRVTTTTIVAQSTTTLSSALGTITTWDMQDKNSGVGAHVYYFNCWMWSDNAGAPGTLLAVASTSVNIGNSAVGTVTCTPSSPVGISPSTKYWFGLSKYVEDNNDTGVVQTLDATSDTGQTSTNGGSSWSSAGAKFYISYTYTDVYEGRVYKASAADTGYRFSGFIGLAKATTSAGSIVGVDMLGMSAATTTLTRNTSYFLSNTQGQLSTSAGTNSLKIGAAFGSQGFLLRPTNP